MRIKRHRLENAGKKENVGFRVERMQECQKLGKSMAKNKRWSKQNKYPWSA